ncbi:MAG: hypothetical protein ACXWI7_01395 [Croceibacterium sp.]
MSIRLPVRRLVAGLALCVATASLAQAADQPITPERDFSGVWTTYAEPGAPPFGGLRAAPPELPLTAEGKRRRDKYRKLTGEDKAAPGSLGGDNPGAHCVPYGMPTMMQSAGGYPIEFILRPEQLTMIYEVESETRRVYMPGHGVVPEKRLPVRQGYSAGHWEGNTLVVETTDMSDGLDQRSYPHSDQAKIVEHFHVVPDAKVGKILEYDMTMTDPVYYTAPVSFTRRWMPLKDGHIMAYNCTEEPWLRLLDARRKQLEAGQPITAQMKDVIDVYN